MPSSSKQEGGGATARGWASNNMGGAQVSVHTTMGCCFQRALTFPLGGGDPANKKAVAPLASLRQRRTPGGGVQLTAIKKAVGWGKDVDKTPPILDRPKKKENAQCDVFETNSILAERRKEDW